MKRALLLLLAVPLAVAAGCYQVKNPDFCCVTGCEQHDSPGPVACDPPRVCDAEKFTCVDPTNGGTCDGMDQCSGVTPYCDLTDHKCKQCLGTMGCSASAPVCSPTEACTTCGGDGDCTAYVKDHLPHCATSGANAGQCVQCRDGADCASGTPVCDANACRGCRTDDECPSHACDSVSGECAAATDVVYMAPTGSGTACSMAQPCGTFAVALGQVGGNRKIIKLAAGSYVEQVAILDKTLTILGDGADLTSSSAGPLLTITGLANVTVDRLRVHGGLGPTGDGVHCNDANGNFPNVTLNQVSVDHNTGLGVTASKCGITVRQSKILRNIAGGIVVTSGTFTIENDFISGNGTTGSIAGGVSLQNITTSGAHVFQFNSVSSNVSSNAANSGVDCVLVSVAVALGNSIVYGNVGGTGKQVGGANCAWTYSDLGDGTAGMGNINMDPQFTTPNQDDLHLMSTSPAKNGGDPTSTVGVDLDGDPRSDGAPDMGADELTP